MREIKFRAYVTKINTMLQSVCVYNDGIIGIDESDLEKAISGKFMGGQ